MARIGRSALFAAVVATGAPIVVFAVGLALAPQPTDFMCFWAGSDLLAQGADPYDPGTWSVAVDGLFPNWLGLLRRPPCPGGYAYPLTTALAMLPLGVLPVRAAALVWMILLLGGMVAGIALLVRGFGLEARSGMALAAITLGSQPAWLTALTSQYGGIDLLALGVLTLPGTAIRPARSAGALLLLLLKPHIAPLVIIERARRMAPRSRATASAIIASLVVISLLIRPAWPGAWVTELLGHRAEMAGTSPTLYGLVRWAGGSVEVAVAAVIVAIAALALALRGRTVTLPGDRVAVGVVAGLLVVPYLSSGDAVLLAVAWAAILRRSASRSLWLVLALIATADVLPWALYALRDPLVPPGDVRNALVLPVTAALLVLALRHPEPTARLVPSDAR